MSRAIINLKVQATKNPGPQPEKGWHFLEQDLILLINLIWKLGML